MIQIALDFPDQICFNKHRYALIKTVPKSIYFGVIKTVLVNPLIRILDENSCEFREQFCSHNFQILCFNSGLSLFIHMSLHQWNHLFPSTFCLPAFCHFLHGLETTRKTPVAFICEFPLDSYHTRRSFSFPQGITSCSVRDPCALRLCWGLPTCPQKNVNKGTAALPGGDGQGFVSHKPRQRQETLLLPTQLVLGGGGLSHQPAQGDKLWCLTHAGSLA